MPMQTNELSASSAWSAATAHRPAKADLETDLAICQSIITAHGGRIPDSNRPNGGTHFRFTLPVPTIVGLDPRAGEFVREKHS
jgi:hypothetical protein